MSVRDLLHGAFPRHVERVGLVHLRQLRGVGGGGPVDQGHVVQRVAHDGLLRAERLDQAVAVQLELGRGQRRAVRFVLRQSRLHAGGEHGGVGAGGVNQVVGGGREGAVEKLQHAHRCRAFLTGAQEQLELGVAVDIDEVVGERAVEAVLVGEVLRRVRKCCGVRVALVGYRRRWRGRGEVVFVRNRRDRVGSGIVGGRGRRLSRGGGISRRCRLRGGIGGISGGRGVWNVSVARGQSQRGGDDCGCHRSSQHARSVTRGP